MNQYQTWISEAKEQNKAAMYVARLVVLDDFMCCLFIFMLFFQLLQPQEHHYPAALLRYDSR